MLAYGVSPSNEVEMNIDVEPVMSFCGPIVNLRRVKANTQVSYGGVYSTKKIQILVSSRLVLLTVSLGLGMKMGT